MYKNIVYDCVSVDQQINRYFRLLDEWYEDIEKLTKIPRYIWFKVIDDELSINYTDFNYVDCKKYILSHKNLEIGDYSTLNYECGEIYGEHPFNEITSTKLPFNEYLSIKNKFPEQLWKSDFIPEGFHESKNIIMIDSRSIEEVELIIKTIFNRVCKDVSKGIR
jgi:hypothetical protein